MIIGDDRAQDILARRVPAAKRLRRLIALAAVGTAAGMTVLAGCGNGLQVAGPSGGANTPVSAPSSSSGPSTKGDASTQPASSSPTGSSTADSSGAPSSATASSDDQPSASDANSDASSDATAGSSDQPSPSASAGPSRTTCGLDDLRVSIRPAPGGGAAGSGYALIDFTNTSADPCWMYGFAGVSFVGQHNGTQLGQPARRDHSQPARRIRLDADEKTSELLQIANADNFPAKQCAPTTADGFRIYPPASLTAVFVPFKTAACQGRHVTQLTVFPVGTKG